MASRSFPSHLVSPLIFKLVENTTRKFTTASSSYVVMKNCMLSKLNKESNFIYGSSKEWGKWVFRRGISVDFAIKKCDFHATRKTLASLEKCHEKSCEKCSHTYNTHMDNTGRSSQEDYTGTLVTAVTCPKCGALQSTKQRNLPNYFEVLGQCKSYRVDAQEISNNAKQLQKKFHPDLYSQKGQDQQNLSQEYSALINKAVSTLSDPITRGWYLLTLSGSLPDNATNDLEKSMTNDPDFLEEVMELNEKLEEITSERAWKEFQFQNLETMKQIHRYLEKAFDENNMKEAQKLLNRMKYFDTLQQKLKELQSKLGIVE